MIGNIITTLWNIYINFEVLIDIEINIQWYKPNGIL